MKICLYSPYIPKHLGGGEKYFFDVARLLAQDHEVSVAISEQYYPDTRIATDEDQADFEKQTLKKYQDFLGVSLEGINIISTPLGSNSNFFSKFQWTKHWDVIYYLTDGSLFFSLAPKNVLHIQFPIKLNKRSPIERLKLANWQVKNTNSYFTKRIVEASWPVKIDAVHQPMVNLPNVPSISQKNKKQKVILNVGRFFSQLHAKRQDVLVETFKDMLKTDKKSLSGWKLVLIGGVEDEAYAKKVAQMAKGLPIEIIHQISRQDLLAWYAKAKVYWHATGFEVDEEAHPEKVEHFGISTIEAMTFGAVPIVVGKGGQIEVLGDQLSELMWQTKAQCAQKTLAIINKKSQWQQFSQLAQERAKVFGQDRFENILKEMIS